MISYFNENLSTSLKSATPLILATPLKIATPLISRSLKVFFIFWASHQVWVPHAKYEPFHMLWQLKYPYNITK